MEKKEAHWFESPVRGDFNKTMPVPQHAPIHALQAGNGLGVCRDKGIEGYQRYLALGVLGRNLQRLGTIFLEKERKRREQMLMMAA